MLQTSCPIPFSAPFSPPFSNDHPKHTKETLAHLYFTLVPPVLHICSPFPLPLLSVVTTPHILLLSPFTLPSCHPFHGTKFINSRCRSSQPSVPSASPSHCTRGGLGSLGGIYVFAGAPVGSRYTKSCYGMYLSIIVCVVFL